MPERGRVLTREQIADIEKRAELRHATFSEVAKVRGEELVALARSHELQRETCPICGHEWRRHDPEDGQCDAGGPALDHADIGPCPCGRQLLYMQDRVQVLSRAALSKVRLDDGHHHE